MTYYQLCTFKDAGEYVPDRALENHQLESPSDAEAIERAKERISAHPSLSEYIVVLKSQNGNTIWTSEDRVAPSDEERAASSSKT